MSGRRATTPEPRAGGRMFTLAARAPVGGTKRRLVLCLLAAYADVGVESPSMRELCERLDMTPRRVDKILKRLEHDGFLRVRWRAGPPNAIGQRRNVYELLVDRRPNDAGRPSQRPTPTTGSPITDRDGREVGAV